MRCQLTDKHTKEDDEEPVVYVEVLVVQPVCVLIWLEAVSLGGATLHVAGKIADEVRTRVSAVVQEKSRVWMLRRTRWVG